MGGSSYQTYGTLPSAVISDGTMPVPVWAVTKMSLTESYKLPPIGSTGAKAVVSAHEDSITLDGVLPGHERFAWKLALETLAETSKRGGGGLLGVPVPGISGLILLTAMTIRTDMQVKKLSFTASATRREALDVSIELEYMPRPSALGKLLDAGAAAVGALKDFAP
ncbi:MAG TPA: hypothetical protein VF245_06880 [Solirubrobacterales bacterium]